MSRSTGNDPPRVSIKAIKAQIRHCIQSLKDLTHSIMRGRGDDTHGFTMLWPRKSGSDVDVDVTIGCVDAGSYKQLSKAAKCAKEKRVVGGINENDR